MANYTISSLKNGNDTYSFAIPYGVCSTAANTAAKTVSVGNHFSLEEGAMVAVKFSNENSVASPTLNVNSTGAKSIYRYGTTAINTGSTTSGWSAGAIQLFFYDGEKWIRDYWYNTTYSNISLGQGYGTCATAEATVAKVVTLSSYTLSTGGIVSVKFTYAVPAEATMNINSRGARNIFHRGAKITAGVIKAGDTATFIYDGTQYHLIAIDIPNISINDQTPTFSVASTRANIGSGEKLSIIFGKIMKYFSDLKAVAFSGSYNDLSNKPTIPTKTSELTNDSGFKTTDNNTWKANSSSSEGYVASGSG